MSHAISLRPTPTMTLPQWGAYWVALSPSEREALTSRAATEGRSVIELAGEYRERERSQGAKG